MAVRNNIVVSIDERGVAGHPDALKISSTSVDTFTIVLYNDTGLKTSVHIDDLQNAIDEVKAFLKARPKQKKLSKPSGLTPSSVIIEDVSTLSES
jgi:hypothetical protein